MDTRLDRLGDLTSRAILFGIVKKGFDALEVLIFQIGDGLFSLSLYNHLGKLGFKKLGKIVTDVSEDGLPLLDWEGQVVNDVVLLTLVLAAG